MFALIIKKRWLQLGIGTILLLHCMYLVAVKVTHLGVIVPALIALFMLLAPWCADSFRRWRGESRFRVWLWRVVRFAFVFWLLSVFVYFLYLQRLQGRIEPNIKPDLIVILGSSTPNAKPSPTLAERLKLGHLLSLASPTVPVVLSGGVDFRQTVSEAQVMRNYILGLGMDESRIVIEDESTSTYENLSFTANKLSNLKLTQESTRLLIVTSDFHTWRSEMIAHKVGWKNVNSAGAVTPLYMRYNAWLREYFACLSGWILGEL